MSDNAVRDEHRVLLLGGTGRTGGRVLEQLLGRGVSVRAIVRSAEKIPADVAGHAELEIIEADLLALRDEELREYVRGCDAVISCLGHVISLKGVFGPPRDLVTQAATRVCRAIEALRPETPVKFILMSSVSVNRPGRVDTRRGAGERVFLSILRHVVPAANDNQTAADFLCGSVRADNAFVEWVAVRPDTLLEGDVSVYAFHEGLINSLARAGSTNMANVAHAMCELVVDPGLWSEWAGKLPVVVNAVSE